MIQSANTILFYRKLLRHSHQSNQHHCHKPSFSKYIGLMLYKWIHLMYKKHVIFVHSFVRLNYHGNHLHHLNINGKILFSLFKISLNQINWIFLTAFPNAINASSILAAIFIWFAITKCAIMLVTSIRTITIMVANKIFWNTFAIASFWMKQKEQNRCYFDMWNLN